MRTVYREKRYVCGEYMDAYIYPVFEAGKHSGGKRKKRKPSTDAQKKLNQWHREEKLARLLHANFKPEELEIHLTYRVQPENDEEAKRHLQNFIRQLKRYIAKHGLGVLKYIAITERGKRGGRYHHQVTIEVEKGIDQDELEQLWTDTEGHGYANSRRLQFNEEGLEGLARYVVKSPAGKKSWFASRNLIDPEPKTRDERISERKARELAENIQDNTQFDKLYPGYLCSKAETWHNDVNGGCYLAVRLYRVDGKFIKPKQKEKETEAEKTSKSMVELPDGGRATESEALSALVREAKQRKSGYGMLVASTTERERVEIIRDYCAEKRRKGRKKG